MDLTGNLTQKINAYQVIPAIPVTRNKYLLILLKCYEKSPVLDMKITPNHIVLENNIHFHGHAALNGLTEKYT